jgi:hypothetical protein
VQPGRQRVSSQLKDAQQRVGRQRRQAATAAAGTCGALFADGSALPVLPLSAPPAEGAPRAALLSSSRLRAAALKDFGQWWWVPGPQAPPRATNSALQQPQHAGISSSGLPAAALAVLEASHGHGRLACLTRGSAVDCANQRDQTPPASRCRT